MGGSGHRVIGIGRVHLVSSTRAEVTSMGGASAESARRSAEAAERANLLVERVAQRVEPVGIPSEEAFGTAVVSQGDVSWRIERPSKNRYLLRNSGTDVAEHVEVDPSRAGVARHLPEDAVIRPGESAEMLIMGTWQQPVPDELYVRWQGQPDWVAVPIT